MAWIEHATSPLPRECSATELHGRYLILYIAPCRSVANNAVPLFGLKPVNFGAGEGNRTLVISLEGFCSTIELHPRSGIRSQVFRDQKSGIRNQMLRCHPWRRIKAPATVLPTHNSAQC